MIRYISSSCILAAAILGIVGDSYDPDRTGLDKITNLGWAAIVVAALGFMVTVIETRRDQSRINWQERQRSEVKRVANRQVLIGVRRLLFPFHIALREFHSKRAHFDIDLDRLDDDPKYPLELLSSSAVRSEFRTIDLRGQPNIFPSCPWWEFFTKSAHEADEILNEAAAKYSGYLEPETLVEIEDLRIDDFVRVRLGAMGDLVLANTHMAALPLDDALEGYRDYASFDLMLRRVGSLIDRVG